MSACHLQLNIYWKKVGKLTSSIGMANKPKAKNSKNNTTAAWWTLGFPEPITCKYITWLEISSTGTGIMLLKYFCW